MENQQLVFHFLGCENKGKSRQKQKRLHRGHQWCSDSYITAFARRRRLSSRARCSVTHGTLTAGRSWKSRGEIPAVPTIWDVICRLIEFRGANSSPGIIPEIRFTLLNSMMEDEIVPCEAVTSSSGWDGNVRGAMKRSTTATHHHAWHAAWLC